MTRSTPRGLRITALTSAAALIAAAISACGSDAASDPKTITVLSSFTTGEATGDQFNKLAKEFTKETGIKIDVEEVNYADLPKTYEAAKLADEERDLIIENLTPDTTDWLPQGQVVDVSAYLDKWGIKDTLDPNAVEYWTQGDSGVAGFPFIGFNWPVWYNTALLKKAGVSGIPQTTDDLVAAAKKLRAAGIQPMALGGGEWPVQNFTTWMVQQHATPDEAKQLFAKGGYCGNKNAMKGLDLFGELRDAGVFIDHAEGYTADQMTSAYFNGKAAMMPSGSWAYTLAPEEIAKVTTLAGFPVTAGGAYSKPTAFRGHSAGLFLSPNGEGKIDAIEKFVKFMYSHESLQGWAGEASQILDVTPESIGDVKSSNPLVVQGTAITDKDVDFLLLPDSFIPAGYDYQPVATEFLGTKGQSSTEFCKALDGLYANGG